MNKFLIITFTLIANIVFQPISLLSATFDCSETLDDVKNTICNDPELKALDEIANIVGKSLGLKIDLNNMRISEGNSDLVSNNAHYEKIADYYADSIFRMLRGVEHGMAIEIFEEIHKLDSWEVEISNDAKILVIKPNRSIHYQLQDGVLLFANLDGYQNFPVYVEFDTHVNAVQKRIDINGYILSIADQSRHFHSTSKYRFQEDCWRLIGEDGGFNNFLVDGPIETYSINHLTGRNIRQLTNGGTEEFMNEVRKICLR